MQDALHYLLSPIRRGLRSRGVIASVVLLALVMQSYAWASHPCHVLQHSLPTQALDRLQHIASGHAADHAHDHAAGHGDHTHHGGDLRDAQSASALLMAHSCPACSACCLAAAVFSDGGASGLLDLRDPGPPVADVLAQPLPPHDPPFHPPRLNSFL
jgi:hypothetical protein